MGLPHFVPLKGRCTGRVPPPPLVAGIGRRHQQLDPHRLAALPAFDDAVLGDPHTDELVVAVRAGESRNFGHGGSLRKPPVAAASQSTPIGPTA